MKRKNVIISIILMLALLFTGCRGEQGEEINIEEKNDEALIVYLVGNEALTNYGESYYQTRYSIGEFLSHALVWGEEGYMYYDAIEAFKKTSSLPVEITFFSTTAALLEQVEREKKNGEKGPDAVIGSYTCDEYCLYPYIEQEMFADLTPYFEQDEIYTGEEYFSAVLQSGAIQGGQYIFPLTFNMNILMSSRESLQQHGVALTGEETYEELAVKFTNLWNEERDEDEMLLMQFSNMWNDYAYVLFDAASGISLIDYETGEIQLDFDYFKRLAELYKAYLINDYAMSQDELRQMADENQGFLNEKFSRYGKISNLAVSKMLNTFEEIHDQTVCFAEGGNSSYFMHSFAAQTGYYESRYADKGEEFVCIGIPAANPAQGYAAQVTSWGAVIKDAQNEEAGYQFIKCLADTKRFMHFDVSVNRNITNETLDDLCETQYEFYPALGNFPPDRVPEGEDWIGDAYTIQPMTKESREYMEHMLTHIDRALLPEWELHRCMTRAIENYIFGQADSLDAAYQQAVREMQSCIGKDDEQEESQKEEQNDAEEEVIPIQISKEGSAKETVERCMKEEFPEADIEEWDVTDWAYDVLEQMPEMKSSIKECYAAGKKQADGPDILILCIVYNEEESERGFPLGMQLRQKLEKEIMAMEDEDKIARGVLLNQNKMVYLVSTEEYRFMPWAGSGWAAFGNFKRMKMPPYEEE